ncbi:MAG TPA: YfiR family protein [Opitutus sp.]|nr:YfiR family protein [Opitutus sp.]
MNRGTASRLLRGAPTPSAPTLRQRRPGATRITRCATLLLLLASFPLFPAPLQAELTKEYQVKAAFVYNFTKFIDWPSDCFSAPRDPLVIAVLGHDPFEGELARVVHGRTVAGRPIALVQLNPAALDAAALPAVHVLFVAAGEEDLLRRLPGPPWSRGVVTIGESSRFAELGGIITFVLVDERVHFGINAARAAAAGVTINAQLQKLATPAAPAARRADR